MSAFYEKISKLCLQKGISPSALAEAIGKNSSTATGWKKGAVPRPDATKQIADYFGVSVSFLTEDKPETLNAVLGDNNVVGNHAQTLIVRNGGVTERVLSDQEVELLRVFNTLTVKDQTRLLSFAFELEGDESYNMAARGSTGVVKIRGKKEKEAVDRAFDTSDDQ